MSDYEKYSKIHDYVADWEDPFDLHWSGFTFMSNASISPDTIILLDPSLPSRNVVITNLDINSLFRLKS